MKIENTERLGLEVVYGEMTRKIRASLTGFIFTNLSPQFPVSGDNTFLPPGTGRVHLTWKFCLLFSGRKKESQSIFAPAVS